MNIATMRVPNAIVAVAALTIATLGTTNANAQTFYSSPSDFNAAAITATSYGFENIATANNYATDPAVLVTPAPGRVTFVVTGGSDSRIIVADSNVNSGVFRLSDGTDSVLAGNPFISNSVTRINLDTAYTAFAIEYGLDGNKATSYTFGLFSGNTPVGTAFVRSLIGGDNFFGVTSAAAFDNVRVTATATGGNDAVVFDNARTGSAVIVPEAGSLALVLPALGVLGVVVAARKRK